MTSSLDLALAFMVGIPVVELSAIFKETTIQNSSEILKSLDGVRNSLDCGDKCVQLPNCYGFKFRKSTNHCDLLSCTGPDQLNTTTSSLLAYVIKMDEMLARGKSQ